MRMQRIQGARHVLVGLTLALAGGQAIADGHHASWVDYLALVSGLLLLVAFVRELRASRRPQHHAHASHGINWIDVFAAAVTFVEAAHLQHLGKVRLPIAYGFVALLLLAVGLSHGRLSQMRRLIVDESGFDIRLQPWKRVQRQWREFSAIAADDTSITLTGLDGAETRLDLADAPQRAAVIAAFTRHGSAALAALAADTPAPSEAVTAVDRVAVPDISTERLEPGA